MHSLLVCVPVPEIDHARCQSNPSSLANPTADRSPIQLTAANMSSSKLFFFASVALAFAVACLVPRTAASRFSALRALDKSSYMCNMVRSMLRLAVESR